MHESYLAPMHGFTDLAFRTLCRRHGAGGAMVPLISASAIVRDRGRLGMIDADPAEQDIGVQLVDRDPGSLALAAKAVSEAFPFISHLNLNCGCPSSRTVGCGGGSAMLDDPAGISEAVSGMKRHAHCPVSVKLRLKERLDDTASLLRGIEEAGADFLIIHGRTRRQGYSGRCDWEAIRSLRDKVDIPVIGNGDIISASQGRGLVREGYCDSYMVGRAAMSNPMLFSDMGPEGLEGAYTLLRGYVSIAGEHGIALELKDVKAKALALSNGFRGARHLRSRITLSSSIEEVLGHMVIPRGGGPPCSGSSSGRS